MQIEGWELPLPNFLALDFFYPLAELHSDCLPILLTVFSSWADSICVVATQMLSSMPQSCPCPEEGWEEMQFCFPLCSSGLRIKGKAARLSACVKVSVHLRLSWCGKEGHNIACWLSFILMISHTPLILYLLCTEELLKTTKQVSYPDKLWCKLSSAALPAFLSLSIRSTTMLSSAQLSLAALESISISS